MKAAAARGQMLLSVVPVQHLEVSGADFDHGCTIVPLKSRYCLQRCDPGFTVVRLKSASDT